MRLVLTVCFSLLSDIAFLTIAPGWMTAELFVKLTAKLYAQRVADGELEASLEPKTKSLKFDSDSTDSEGGVSLYPPYGRLGRLPLREKGGLKANAITETASSFQDEEPPAWHAAKLNGDAKPYLKSLFVVIDEIPKPNVVKKELDMKQWIPAFDEPFWEVYTNKLRVNAAEGGVCDLAQNSSLSTPSSSPYLHSLQASIF
jgi:poly(A)-specific ribonuclease